MTMNQEWVEPTPIILTPEYQKIVGGHPLVAETLWRRGVFSEEQVKAFLDPAQYVPADPLEMPDMVLAVERISSAIQNHEKILIWGDFDVDGQTAASLLVSALKEIGGRVDYHLPIRKQETHGISLPILEIFLESSYQLIITCDTGINAHEAVDYASSRGADVIITDHHTLPGVLPHALAVVSSQRVPSEHPLHNLTGVGCAYKLVEALYQKRGISGTLYKFLDLVALGTVADLGVLIGENRYLVQRGLELLRSSPRPAIKAILSLANVNSACLTEEHISFILAPRMNALGRLGDANPMVEFLLTLDADKAARHAIELERVNGQRKLLSEQIFQSARSIIEQDSSLLDNPVLIMSHPGWESSVIGIVASRLVEIYQRPSVMISAPPGLKAHGSARSFGDLNITEALSAQREMLISFGGHPMAAGFSLPFEKLGAFKNSLIRTVRQLSSGQIQTPKIQIDAFIELKSINLEMVADLDRLAPFGQGNRPLTFAAQNLKVVSQNPIGKNDDHVMIIVEDPSGTQQSVIWWQGAGCALPENYFDLAFSVRASNYQGKHRVQVEWICFRDSEPAENQPEIIHDRREIIDYRFYENPLDLILRFKAEVSTIIWAEGELDPTLGGLSRYDLLPASTLVVWNIPPGRSEMMEAIRKVDPIRLILMGANPGFDHFEPFTTRLGGMIRFAINKNSGWISTTKMASATGHREITIRKGIAWFIARGDIQLISEEDERFQLALCGMIDSGLASKTEAEVRALLFETAAYRSYYLRASLDRLV